MKKKPYYLKKNSKPKECVGYFILGLSVFGRSFVLFCRSIFSFSSSHRCGRPHNNKKRTSVKFAEFFEERERKKTQQKRKYLNG